MLSSTGGEGELLYGLNVIRGALSAKRRTHYELMVDEKIDTSEEKYKSITEWASTCQVPVRTYPKRYLAGIVRDKNFQHMILNSSRLKYEQVDGLAQLDHLAEAGANTVVFLDQINDPQNFGAILRSAHYHVC